MTLSKLKNNKQFIYSLAFVIPALLMLLVCIFNKIYPFGNNALLISDANGQYIDYLSYFKTIFTSNNDFFYTFSKNMGGDMVGLSAYYLISPLNFIFLFFSNENLPVALFLIILIKIGLCGLTFNYFINKCNDLDWKSLVFSTSYALMAYNMTYFWDIMWIDGVILLPLIVLGINNILSSSKPYLYIISLSAALITNYYIGFMLCIFSVIYFVYRLLLSINSLSELKLYTRRILQYIISSLASACLSAFILIPTFKSLQGGKAQFSLSMLSFTENFKFIDVFTKLYTNSMDGNQLINGLPNIFCGMLIVSLVILYFFNSKITSKEKLLSAGILSVMLISFHINTFNLIWHGFNPPAWFPYRYSFMFSFLLIHLAYKSFLNLNDGIKNKDIIYCAIIFIISSIIIFKNDYSFVNVKNFYLDVFLIICLCTLLYLLKNSINRKKVLIILIVLIQVGNLSLNAIYSIRKLQDFDSSTMDTYTSYIQNTKPVINNIKTQDTSFYRLEKTFQRTHNDAMQFNYNGLSHYSSSEKTFVKSFLGKLGFRYNDNWSYYNNGSTVSVDSFLGVKYLLSKEKINKPYDKLFTKNDITTFQNPYTLPIGFAVSDKVLKVNLNTPDLFKVQNKIFSSMTNKEFNNIFTPADVIDMNIKNLKVTKLKSSTKYEKIDAAKDAFISYKIKVDNINTLYTYISAPQCQGAEIFINNKPLGPYFDSYRWDIVSLGKFDKDTTVTFKIKVNDNAIEVNKAFFYYENIDVLQQYYNELSNEPCNLEKISSSHLKGTINIKDDNKYLLFTIPQEKDWKVTIDGKKVKTVMVFDALMAIPISEGEHTIELKYIPSGLYLGIGISALSSMAVLVYSIWSRRNKTK